MTEATTLANKLRDDSRDRTKDPKQVDTRMALVILGADPDRPSCIAFRYTSLESALEYAAVNRELHGHEVIGPVETAAGVIAVLDFSRSLNELRARDRGTSVTVSVDVPAAAFNGEEVDND